MYIHSWLSLWQSLLSWILVDERRLLCPRIGDNEVSTNRSLPLGIPACLQGPWFLNICFEVRIGKRTSLHMILNAIVARVSLEMKWSTSFWHRKVDPETIRWLSLNWCVSFATQLSDIPLVVEFVITYAQIGCLSIIGFVAQVCGDWPRRSHEKGRKETHCNRQVV